MPISEAFKTRLYPQLDRIAKHFGTPFHIYDEAGIRATGQALKDAFAGAEGFREFFAVKALPNPFILTIMREMGFGFDCSSIPELMLARNAHVAPTDIMFTSNNTSEADFLAAAAHGGCILNLDDISLIGKVPLMPELICFRYNPGAKRSGNAIIGKPEEAKYGVSDGQIADAYHKAQERGAKRFGLHSMLTSNELVECGWAHQTRQAPPEAMSWAHLSPETFNSIFAFVQKPPAAHVRKGKIAILKRRRIGERRYKLFVLNTDRFKYHTKYLRFINTASPSSYSFRLLSNTHFPDLIGIEAAYCYLTTLSALPTLINARIALSRCFFS